ncbi:HEAT repeat domain-containing protein [Pseudodesulfovibrio piezophilus]|uniref:PBS lyase HEAT domain protein repeat-containing protein n=1 Tax=Pseudodesulfovibrio piezophilus (strain DSM 21447 / JCM 15486 / C1TLV30) TaxID=1322246 RepID=M1WJI9_PSEP2|nr:HEAT repeat domain-containing protein [Pseudodesulfovibrio piezophilus]CCH47976.1 PBS lyase HEAT domain protein repeat-containing protein [Pseudodesulfovibrio piezophilus C1TLV30]
MAECTEYLALLKSDDKEVVREGAFRAGEDNCVEAVGVLAELLQTNHLGIQEAADSSLRKIGGKETVRAVLPLLRSDEAPVRNLSMDILREVGCQDLPSLIELVHDEDTDIRIFATDILGSTDNLLAVEPLCMALLKDPEVNVRYQAAVSLGELGKAEAAPCLNKAIEDEEWVQYSVVEALTKIGHASSVDAMVKALDKASDLVASMIIDSLGEMGNVKAVTMLLRRMDDSHTALRNKIVKAVVKILGGKSLTLLNTAERERFREYLLVALKDEDEDIQDAAIQGLAYVGGEQASGGILDIASKLDQDRDQERLNSIIGFLAEIGLTDALREGVHGENPDRARVSVQALSQVSPGATCSERDVCGVLMAAFWEVGLPIQRQIVSVTAERGGEHAQNFFIKILDEHTDGTVLKSAVYFLGEKLRLAEVADRIFPLLQHQYDDVKEAALEACIAINGPVVRERFKAMFSSDNPVDRLMSTYALGKLGAMENLDVLGKALEDEIPDIRKVAIEALATSCESYDEWKPMVLGMLDDESKDVRLTVIEILGKCFTEDFVQYMIRALDDGDDWVKIRAIDALGEHQSKEAVPKLIEMLENPNRFVQMKIIEALGGIGGTSAFRALLEMTNRDEYELVSAAESAISNIQEAQG